MASVSFRMQSFEPKYQPEVVALIEKIQVKEFGIAIEEGQRKELQSISDSFQKKGNSNYWVALLNEKVIGTIAVVDIGHHDFELRDVFLDEKHRGKGYAQEMLKTVLIWAKSCEVNTIYLGTTNKFKAAHRFYEKSGFQEIHKSDMPPWSQPMDRDEKFYRLELKA